MASRSELELRARVLNIVAANYPNDSTLEQAILYKSKTTAAAAGSATYLAIPATAYQTSGDANV